MKVSNMDFYTLTAIKFALGVVAMILQINILGKYDFSLNTPLNQVQNYVLGGIIGGVIYNQSISMLQFLIVLLIWSLIVIAVKILFGGSKAFQRAVAGQPELLIYNGKVDIPRCAKVGLTAEQLCRGLRENSIFSVGDVDAAIMESDGRLTICAGAPKCEGMLLPLVSDGQLVPDGLKLAGKNEEWVMGRIKALGYSSIGQVFLAEFVNGRLEVIPYSESVRMGG